MSVKFIIRVCLLFLLGVGVSLLINVIQAQRSHTLITSEWLGLIKSGMWVPPVCGISSVLIGLLYPTLDHQLGNPVTDQHNDWTSVIRCVALFVGLNHATAKIDFMSHEQLSLCLATMSLGLWFYFDGSRPGLGLSLVIALLASAVNQLMICLDAYRPSVDFLHVRAWLPCIFFSGSVTVGLIGRQLAKSEYLGSVSDSFRAGLKAHQE
ncbi:hypothetical protein BOX15_Mlig014876g3 [Macrostomum lignano]|uniref:Insulin-induced gene protein n=2 Tax=Macrostomum lignano TaxID=282301 RepID=A0A1I8FU60_9PLAT|nr:hypothetical protein BOX15_Mlig014876g1 [Macrostomum lignano]PAA87127.1 hypothetical protein BOX15_Mlig014876g2 [Macrostomum lignano]PAA91511.1 hypothetical protein BOX15_Mlig014876g3 [Macrostomum lignano]